MTSSAPTIVINGVITPIGKPLLLGHLGPTLFAPPGLDLNTACGLDVLGDAAWHKMLLGYVLLSRGASYFPWPQHGPWWFQTTCYVSHPKQFRKMFHQFWHKDIVSHGVVLKLKSTTIISSSFIGVCVPLDPHKSH